MAERIGQYINRTLRESGNDFANDANALSYVPRDLADQFQGAQQGVTRFLGDVAGQNPYVPEPPVAARLNAARVAGLTQGAGGPVTQPIGVPNATPGDNDKTHTYGANMANVGPPMPDRMRVYDTPDNPGSLSYTDHGVDQDRGATLAGLRQRAMSTGAMNYPNLQEYNHSYTPSAPNSYDRPMGGASAPIVMNPLLSLSASQIAQDEGARTEREARFGGERQDRLTQQAQELQGEQLRYQMEDPTGIEMKRKLMQLEVGKLLGLEQGKSNIQAGSREALRQRYTEEATQIQGAAEQAIAQIQRSNITPAEKEAKVAAVQARLQMLQQKLDAGYGISEHINSPGLLGKGETAGY